MRRRLAWLATDCGSPLFDPDGKPHDCKRETKAMKAAARASMHAVWPPVPKGYGPPASHLRKPTLTSVHPLAWVNDALRPAWRRFIEKSMEGP